MNTLATLTDPHFFPAGYTLHHRGRAGEWVETVGDPAGRSVIVRGLSCGAPHHLYLTAWNNHGTSAPSPVLVTSTLGSREYQCGCTHAATPPS